MKTTNFLLMLAIINIAGCKQKPAAELEKPDIEGAKKAITELLDQFHLTMKSKNTSGMMNLLTEDGLFCGTDPTEFWDKKTLTDFANKTFNDTAVVINKYPIDKREIRIALDAKSAVTAEQFIINMIHPKIFLRFITHLVKKEDNWKIDFLSWSLVPGNADMPKINEAVK